MQLRILQILPALTQNYPAELKDDALSSVLQLCSTLQNVRAYAISNTATATLQHLVSSTFDKVATEDGRYNCQNDPDPTNTHVKKERMKYLR